MEDYQNENNVKNWFKTSITAKMLVVGALIVVLLIPLLFVQNLIEERKFRQQDVITETNDKWGNAITLSGPILKIPYKTYQEQRVYNKKNEDYDVTTKEVIKTAYFLPEQLDITSTVDSKPLNRGIYESVVFTTNIKSKGQFPKVDFSGKDIKDSDILWDKATIFLQTSNLKGIKNTIEVNLGGKTLAMTPVFGNGNLNTITSTVIEDYKDSASKSMAFAFEMTVNGSKSLEFIPIGKETSVSMTSNWHSPSFFGRFLPDDETKTVSKDGFTATWKVLQINRQFEQVFYENFPNLSDFAFGTELIIPVDEYQKSERSAKYGFMVIGLTFLVFLLIQLVSKIYIHPFQYLMIGLALVMFYTLLISISEHSSFLKAYLIAAIAVLGLIGLYSRSILKGIKFPALILASLSALYGFIYVIIQLENYALLVGSIGLFVILGIIMFASRKIDWVNN